MKKLLFLSLLIPVVFLSGCASKDNNQSGSKVSPNAASEEQVVADSERIIQPLVAPLKSIAKDNFTINVPSDWAEQESAPGTILTMVRTGDIQNSVAKKLDFRSRFTISYQYLGAKTFKTHLAELEDQIKGDYPQATFIERDPISKQYQRGRVVEGTVTQDGLNYKFLVFMIAGRVAEDGKARDAWILSFITLKDEITLDLPIFYNIVDSLKER